MDCSEVIERLFFRLKDGEFSEEFLLPQLFFFPVRFPFLFPLAFFSLPDEEELPSFWVHSEKQFPILTRGT